MATQDLEDRLRRLEDKVDRITAWLGIPGKGGEIPPPESSPLSARRVVRPLMWSSYSPWGYEYRSEATFLGLPLVHIAQGIDPQTGRMRVARGIIAVGNVAIGVLAIGGFALGGIALGGFALGVVALAGIAVGFASFGGMALGLWLALGGMAVSAQYAVGGLALAPHALGGNVQDPELLRWLERVFGQEWLP